MGTVYSIGQMVPIMRVIGVITKQKAKEPSGMQKVTCTVAILKTIWLMGMVSILTLTDLNIKESLEMMCKKDTERRNGLMEQNMWAPIKTE